MALDEIPTLPTCIQIIYDDVPQIGGSPRPEKMMNGVVITTPSYGPTAMDFDIFFFLPHVL